MNLYRLELKRVCKTRMTAAFLHVRRSVAVAPSRIPL